MPRLRPPGAQVPLRPLYLLRPSPQSWTRNRTIPEFGSIWAVIDNKSAASTSVTGFSPTAPPGNRRLRALPPSPILPRVLRASRTEPWFSASLSEIRRRRRRQRDVRRPPPQTRFVPRAQAFRIG